MNLRSGLRAFGLGIAPCLLVGFVVVLMGWNSASRVPSPDGQATIEALERRARALRRQLPEEFSVAVASPFVLVVEGSAADAAAYRTQIERQQRELERRELEPPEMVHDIWIFANTASYRSGARAYLDDWPRTLEGYYAPTKRAVVVNRASGDATLLHEMAHPYIAATHPGLPAWVDEGLASMFEPAHAILPRLQRTLVGNRLPSIAALSAGTDSEFYDDPRRLSYAQARYVMTFLVQRGQLAAFLQRLEASEDKTGLEALLQATGAPNAHTLQAWLERYVLSLDASVAHPLGVMPQERDDASYCLIDVLSAH